MTSKITISPLELKTLTEWVESMEKSPHRIILISEGTAIGNCIRAEIETAEGEGLWKDLTDYNNW